MMPARIGRSLSLRAARARRRARAVAHYVLPHDPPRKYFYVSHHKCATKWTIRVLFQVARRLGIEASHWGPDGAVSRRDLVVHDLVMLHDYRSGMIDWDLARGRGFHVIRDPRDLLVSMYYSHRHSHETDGGGPLATIAGERRALSGLGEVEGLIWVMDHSSFWSSAIREMTEWDYGREDFHETTFERLTTDPGGEFGRVFDFLGLDVPGEVLDRVLEIHSFEAMKRRWRGENPDAPINHYRRGKPGDWREHLVGEARDVFEERYGRTVERLGYA